MDHLPSLIHTFQEALGALEDYDSAEPDPVLKAICRDTRLWMEALQRLEQADDNTLLQFIEEIFLRRKGICILRYASAGSVRETLRAKGFARPAKDVSNESLANLMESTVCLPDIAAALDEIEDRTVETTAREVVEGVGLEWPEPKEE